MKLRILFAILIISVGCTTTTPVKRPDYIGRNDVSFGLHSVIIDKRYEFKNTDNIMLGYGIKGEAKVSSWHYGWRDETASIFFREVVTPAVYWKPIKWSDHYENVMIYEKEQFAQEGDIYSYRMIRHAEPMQQGEFNNTYIISHFHFVGNQRWLITEYKFTRTMKYRYGDANGMFTLADRMILIRHKKVPEIIKSISKGMERVNAILFR